jgi:polyferredoxin
MILCNLPCPWGRMLTYPKSHSLIQLTRSPQSNCMVRLERSPHVTQDHVSLGQVSLVVYPELTTGRSDVLLTATHRSLVENPESQQ